MHGTTYIAGTTTELLYVASGGSTDWAYGEAKIPYVYCVELRDTGIHLCYWAGTYIETIFYL